jgi:hypothetical protein
VVKLDASENAGATTDSAPVVAASLRDAACLQATAGALPRPRQRSAFLCACRAG